MRPLQQILAFGTVLALAAPMAMAQCTPGSTLIVGPADQYAFQWCNGTSVTQIGLNFASSVNEYQFKKSDGTNLMTLNPTGGNYVRMGSPDAGNYASVSGGGDLTFVGGGDYLVGNNRYAFRSSSDQDNGLFFNVASNQYEFRANDATSGFSIKANTAGGATKGSFVSTGNGDIDGNLVVGALTSADGNGINAHGYASGRGAVRGQESSGATTYSEGFLGVLSPTAIGVPVSVTNVGVLGIKRPNGSNGAAVYGWNNDVNFTNYGGLFVSDGVSSGTNYGVFARASNATNNVAGYFDGDVEVTGNLTANLNQPTITGLATVSGIGNNNANTVGIFEVQNTGLFGTTSLGMDGNEIQAYSGDTATGTLYLNYWGGGMDVLNGFSNPNSAMVVGSGNLHVSNATDRVGIGTYSAGGKLGIVNATAQRSLDIQSSASTGQMVNLQMTVDPAIGNDIIQITVPSTAPTGFQFLEFDRGGSVEFQVNGDGHLGVGTSASSTYAIQACGSIRATEVVVETGWCDYVFEDDYALASLSDVEQFIKTNKHLPGIPSAAEVEGNGLPLAEMSANFMQKIEELTLYTIEQQKLIDALMDRLETLENASH